MKIFTIVDRRDPVALKTFIQTCVNCGSTGVTIFTRPEFVQPVVPPGSSVEELQSQADVAALQKNYKEAARVQDLIEAAKAQHAELLKVGAQWIIDEMEPIATHAKLVVIGNLHWLPEVPFNAATFMAKLEEISTKLLTTGIAGVKQQTPLSQRTFIPLTGGGHATQGEPAGGSSLPPVETATPVKPQSARHASIPANLSEKQARFAELRLGLDRGGQRRSRQEAGNMLGYSPNIGTKMENAISAVWPLFLPLVNENMLA